MRSALCDVELLEFFFEEHGIAWPLARKISTCAGNWDEPARPWELDLLKGKTWGRHRENANRGFFPGASIEDLWQLTPPAANERVLIWYTLQRWRPGLVLDVTVNDDFRRVLRYDPARNFARILPAYRQSWTLHGRNTGPTKYTPEPILPAIFGYVAFWLPGSFRSDNVRVNTRMIDLPDSLIGRGEPAIVHRSVTLISK